MDGVARETVPFRGGQLTLTDTHLYVVHGNYLAESLALRHLSDVTAEQAQSFRHRIFGAVVGVALLSPAAMALVPENLVGNLALFAMFRGRLVIAVVFAVFFGLLFLWGVVTSRRIWWLRVRYGGTRKLIPLPGAKQEALDRFVQALIKKVEKCGL